MGKFFKTLISSVKSFKSPSKQKAVVKDQRLALSQEDRNASHRKDDDDHTDVMKKGCLWSLSKSSSRNREIAIHITSPDALESGETQEKQGKEEEPEQKEKQEKQKELEKPSPADPELQSSIDPPRAEIGIDEHRLLLERSSSKKIQRAFRSYQARRECRALKALVRLQALARGRITRGQRRITWVSFNALVRVQGLLRGRHVRKSELGRLVQKHLQQAKQQRRKAGVLSPHRQDAAAVKRQRSLLDALSAELQRSVSKQRYASESFQPEKAYWVWIWLERWTEAHRRGGHAGTVARLQCVEIKNVEKKKADLQLPMECSSPEESNLSAHRSRPNPIFKIGASVEEAMVVNESAISTGEDGIIPAGNDSTSFPIMKSSAEEQESMAQTEQYEIHSAKPDEDSLVATDTERVDLKQESPRAANEARSHSSSLLEPPISSFDLIEPMTIDSTPQASSVNVDETDTGMSLTKAIKESHHVPILAEDQPENMSRDSPADFKDTSSEAIEVSMKQSPTPSSAFSLVGCVSPAQPVSPLAPVAAPNAADNNSFENANVAEEKSKNGVDSDQTVLDDDNHTRIPKQEQKDTVFSKQEEQTLAEQVSPSLPSYMATTKSSMAKSRVCKPDPLKVRGESLSPIGKQDSPKLKQDSPKPRQDSPKPKQDCPAVKQVSPKPNQDSPKPSMEALKLRTNSLRLRTESPKPNTKSDPAIKRRYSLSALEGKNTAAAAGATTTTTALSCAQRPTMHVKANSRAKVN